MKAWHLRPNYMDLSFITPIWTSETARFLFKLSELKKAEEKEPYEGREIDEREVNILTDAELREEINKHIQTVARCGKAEVIEAYLAGQLEEYIKEERRKAFAAGFLAGERIGSCDDDFEAYEKSLEGEK